jgi:hypothetical protein
MSMMKFVRLISAVLLASTVSATVGITGNGTRNGTDDGAAFGAAVETGPFKRQYISSDGFLRVYSDHSIAPARCRAIVERVEKAYRYDSEHEGWRKPALLWRQPLTIRVLGDGDGKGGAMKSSVLGYAIGGKFFVVRDSYLDDPLSDGTLAHELTHVQDARQLRGGRLPSWLLEGRALTNGHNYRIQLGLAEDSFDRMVANSAVNCTTGDAAHVLGTFREQGLKMQNIGTFFVEYLRTKWRGHGVGDVHTRLSRMIEAIASGLVFEQAFEGEFGEPLSSAVAAFQKYLVDTEASPRQRLEGTMWQKTLD